MAVFVVERALPGLTAELLEEAQRCLQRATLRVSAGGEEVRYLRCIFIPGQERCLDLFEAPGAASVRRVSDVAQVPFRWIGPGVEYAAPGAVT